MSLTGSASRRGAEISTVRSDSKCGRHPVAEIGISRQFRLPRYSRGPLFAADVVKYPKMPNSGSFDGSMLEGGRVDVAGDGAKFTGEGTDGAKAQLDVRITALPCRTAEILILPLAPGQFDGAGL